MTQIAVSLENLQAIARTARAQSGQLGVVERTINNAIVSSGWASPAATRFTHDWNSTYVRSLRDLEQALVGLADAAATMAHNYEANESTYVGLA